MNDMSFVANSYSVGAGISYKVTDKVTLTAAYFQTNYGNYDKVQARDADGTVVGKIIDVDEQTENALFIIDHDGSQLMVPACDDLIVEFDEEASVMVMDLPKGIMDLN
jgi:hypothetical protein